MQREEFNKRITARVAGMLCMLSVAEPLTETVYNTEDAELLYEKMLGDINRIGTATDTFNLLKEYTKNCTDVIDLCHKMLFCAIEAEDILCKDVYVRYDSKYNSAFKIVTNMLLSELEIQMHMPKRKEEFKQSLININSEKAKCILSENGKLLQSIFNFLDSKKSGEIKVSAPEQMMHFLSNVLNVQNSFELINEYITKPNPPIIFYGKFDDTKSVCANITNRISAYKNIYPFKGVKHSPTGEIIPELVRYTYSSSEVDVMYKALYNNIKVLKDTVLVKLNEEGTDVLKISVLKDFNIPIYSENEDDVKFTFEHLFEKGETSEAELRNNLEGYLEKYNNKKIQTNRW